MPKSLDQMAKKAGVRSLDEMAKAAGVKPLSEQQAEEPAKDKSFMEKWKGFSEGLRDAQKDFIIGQLKGVGSTALSMGKAGSDIMGAGYDATIGRLTGKKSLGTGQVVEQAKQAIAPTNAAQKAGFFTEQVGEFFIPVPGGAKAKLAGAVAERLPQAAKLAATVAEKAPALSKVVNFTAKAGFQGIEDAARTYLQSGDTEAAKQAGGYSAAMPFAGKALSGLGSLGKGVLKFTASKMSGVPIAAIEHAFSNPNSTRSAIRAMAKDPELGATQVVESAEEALSTLKNIRRDSYRQGLKEVQESTMQNKNGQWYVKKKLTPEDVRNGTPDLKGRVGQEMWVPTDLSTKGIKDTATKTFKDFGAKMKGDEIDMSKMALPNAQKKELQEVVDKVYAWDDLSPMGIDDLRENISVFRKGGVNPSSADKKFNAIVDSLLDNTRGYIEKRVPQISKMNKDYHAQSKTIENVSKTLSLGKDSPRTAGTKLMSVFNPRATIYKPIVDELGEKAGKDLMSDIAGLTMSKWTPEGLASYVSSLGLLGVGTAALTPSTLLAAPLASPRLVGEAATTLGSLSQTGLPKTAAEMASTALRGAQSKYQQSR